MGFISWAVFFYVLRVPEALYSDLGHCGKWNIRNSWVFVKTCLILNYLGQGAWLLSHYNGKTITAEMINSDLTLYGVMPDWLLYFGIADCYRRRNYCQPGIDIGFFYPDKRSDTD